MRDNLDKFVEQQETVQEMKQSKCKLAFKGLWLHNQDQRKYELLKDEYRKRLNILHEKK